MNLLYPKIIKKKVFKDSRGFLQEIFKKKKFKINFKFSLLVNSKKNVFRGFHFQKRKQQHKILIVAQGELNDYCLDLRRKSKSFQKIFKFNLKQNSILFIPKGFAHAYVSLKKNTQVIYFLSEYRFKKYEETLSIYDKKLNLKIRKNYILSKKDKKGISIDIFNKKIKSL